MTLRIGSLCSGYEGIGLAVQEVLGGELAWVADNDPGAAAILAWHYPDVPNLGDITTVDWAEVEPVDVLTAGFPCQDVSCAGARAGLRKNNRTGVWAHVASAVDTLRPALVVLENVRGLLSAGADSNMEPCPWCLGETGDELALRASGAVHGDLASLGYDTVGTVVRASDAGAPHRRERVFIAAQPAANPGGRPVRRGGVPGVVGCAERDPACEGDQRERHGRNTADSCPAAAEDADGAAGGERRLPAPGQTPGGRARADASRPDRTPPADPGCVRLEGLRADPGTHQERQAAAAGGQGPARSSGSLAYASSPERGRPQLQNLATADERTAKSGERTSPLAWGAYEPAIRRWEAILRRPAPSPTEPGRTGDRLSPAFVEFMMGLPEGWVTGVPGLSRNQQLRAIGNGVVPQQCELALRLLLPAISSPAG